MKDEWRFAACIYLTYYCAAHDAVVYPSHAAMFFKEETKMSKKINRIKFKVVCETCGNDIKTTDDYCPFCGSKIFHPVVERVSEMEMKEAYLERRRA